MNELEKKIKEQRTIEATKRGLTGIGGKFGVIVRNLGQPVLDHSEGGAYFSTNYLEDPWETNSSEIKDGPPEFIQGQIPYMDIEGNAEPLGGGFRDSRSGESSPINLTEIGWNFDGLNRGVHLEINYVIDRNEISVYYKGYTVYKESGGELESYSPSEDWEQHIDKFYNQAVEMEKKSRKKEKAERIESAKKAKVTFLEKIKAKWGIT